MGHVNTDEHIDCIRVCVLCQIKHTITTCIIDIALSLNYIIVVQESIYIGCLLWVKSMHIQIFTWIHYPLSGISIQSYSANISMNVTRVKFANQFNDSDKSMKARNRFQQTWLILFLTWLRTKYDFKCNLSCIKCIISLSVLTDIINFKLTFGIIKLIMLI